MSLNCITDVFPTKMMTEEEAKIVKLVYNRFIDSEDQTWTTIDDNLEFVDYLTDDELIREASIKADDHSVGVFRCKSSHEANFCFAPFILESVNSILSLNEKTGELHPKNRYILTYYLSMSELGLIYSSTTSSAV